MRLGLQGYGEECELCLVCFYCGEANELMRKTAYGQLRFASPVSKRGPGAPSS